MDKENNTFSALLQEEMKLATSIEKSGLQDSFLFRGRFRAQAVAQELLNAQGDLDLDFVKRWLLFFEKQGFIFYEGGENDAEITEHLKRGLRWLLADPEAKRLIKSFQNPLCHGWAEQLVEPSRKPTDIDIRRGVLAALLTPMRQSVGSCFATAPAIFIQKEQPAQFMRDLHDLLVRGKLKRIFDGVEYAVPISPRTGLGDLKKPLDPSRAHLSPGLHLLCEVGSMISPALTQEERERAVKELIDRLQPATAEELLQDKKAQAAFKQLCEHPLLKVWEFTLASFSEIKMEFSKWNFYIGLGMQHTETGGIGEVIYQYLENQLQEQQELIQKFHLEYEVTKDQLLGVERLLAKASTPEAARRLQAQHQIHLYHMQTCLEIREDHQKISSKLSQLYVFLCSECELLFPEYFQEIYDAEMQIKSNDRYDDSPAGFRLMYKHGRSDPSMWTMVEDADSYIQVLRLFFSAIEHRLSAACSWKGGDKMMSALVAIILEHLETPLFLETALKRMEKAYTKTHQKPWAYISGGTMTTLLKTYCRRSADFTEESKWVESEAELLTFLIDQLKLQSHVFTMPYEKDPYRGMLMSSPTHAFALRPGLFQQAWQNDLFTYTWIRDQIIQPAVEFYRSIQLDVDAQKCLLAKWQEGELLNQTLSVAQWREHMLKVAPADAIDRFLYEALPLVSKEQAQSFIGAPVDVPPLMTSCDLQKIAKAHLGKTLMPIDLHQTLINKARQARLAYPTPLLFADSNWSMFYFGFIVNPATEQLQLWCLNRIASQGFPMSSWKHWLDGTDRRNWTLYTRPSEYS